MELNLEHLHQMHPLLPLTTAIEYAHRAALGLERHDHKPGIRLTVDIDDGQSHANLHWLTCSRNDAVQLDRHRITEDAAEAIALALVYEAKGWVVRRRLQRGESADWLLVDRQRMFVALEISGIDEGDNGRRLREKQKQVALTTAAAQKAACVIELASPGAAIASTCAST